MTCGKCGAECKLMDAESKDNNGSEIQIMICPNGCNLYIVGVNKEQEPSGEIERLEDYGYDESCVIP